MPADLLKYRCPDHLPKMRIDPDLECLGKFEWSFLSTAIVPRHWREGNLRDQACLVHELVYWIQYENAVDMTGNVFYQFDKTEVEAVTAECRWLQLKGENPADHLSEQSIFKMTGDWEFSLLNWL